MKVEQEDLLKLNVKPFHVKLIFKERAKYEESLQILKNSPKNDLKLSISRDMEEKILRIKLAAAYRLVDMFGWSEVIYNHLTLRVPKENESDQDLFLINPFGLHFSEITGLFSNCFSILKVQHPAKTNSFFASQD